MNKGIKILIGVSILIVVLALTYIILIIKGILPNPFLDTSDLVCFREIYGMEYEGEKVVTTKFDKSAITTNVLLKEELEFYELQDAENFFEDMKESLGENYENYLIIDGKKVTINKNDYELTEDDFITRKQTKELYKSGGYECE